MARDAPHAPVTEAGAGGVRPRSRPRPALWLLALQAGAIVLVASLLALLGWRVISHGAGQRLVADIRAGRKPPAPDFSLGVLWTRDDTWPPGRRPGLDDGSIAVRELRGYPVVINFWASWCVPCKKEAPLLNRAAHEYQNRVLVLGIDVHDLSSDARRFLNRHRASYPSVRDRTGETYNDYGLVGVPETYYLDRRGRIVAHSVGQLTSRELELGARSAMTD